MATLTKVVGVSMQDDPNSILIDVLNPRHPFAQGYVEVCKHYLMGTDFTSGDTLQLDVVEGLGLMWADVKEDGGSGVYASKAFTASDISSGNAGKRVSIANCVGDILVNIKIRVS